MIEPLINERIVASGRWKKHPTFGDQFVATTMEIIQLHQMNIQNSILNKDGLKLQSTTNDNNHTDIDTVEHPPNDGMTNEQLVTYLSSNLRGIGPAKAQSIVDAFGVRTLEILNNNITALGRLPTISNRLLQQLTTEWQSKSSTRDTMMFLARHGISGALAAQLTEEYGAALPLLLTKNPYRITRLRGIGFLTADNVARALGFATLDSRERLTAAIWHVLSESMTNDVYLPQNVLLKEAVKLIRTSEFKPDVQALRQCLAALVAEGAVIETRLMRVAVPDKAAATTQPTAPTGQVSPAARPIFNPFVDKAAADDASKWRDLVSETAATTSIVEPAKEEPTLSPSTTHKVDDQSQAVYYMPQYFKMETQLASMLARLITYQASTQPTPKVDPTRTFIDEDTNNVGDTKQMQLSDEQVAAVKMATTGNSTVSVLTGGPGCGKTLTVRTIVRSWQSMSKRCLLLAPTGRASSRLAELTSHPASTIHRALKPKAMMSRSKSSSDNDTEYQLFHHNETNPLPYDAVVVDEMSMVGLPLMHALVSALRPGCRLLLVGDAEQLPPLTAGDTLADIITSGMVPTTRLTKPFRQAARSHIISNAHHIRHGDLPQLESVGAYIVTKPRTDCLFIDLESINRWQWQPRTLLPTPSMSATETRTLQSEQLSNAYMAQKALAWMVEQLLPSLGFTPYKDLQVLTPMKAGATGTQELNKTLAVLQNEEHRKRLHLALQQLKLQQNQPDTNITDWDTINKRNPNKSFANNNTTTTTHKDQALYATGDRVMQVKNDYRKTIVPVETIERTTTTGYVHDTEFITIGTVMQNLTSGNSSSTSKYQSEDCFVANGELGVVTPVRVVGDDKALIVRFDDPLRYMVYSRSEQQSLTPGWCTTVHKSQGSEHPVVAFFLTNSNYVMLYRALLYTGLTRAKKLAIIVGQRSAIQQAVANLQPPSADIDQRHSWLHERLKAACLLHSNARS